jgi:hypothetical protein
MKSIASSRIVSASLIMAFAFAALFTAPAAAVDGCPDGNSSDNTLECSSDTGFLNTWDGKGGDDGMIQTEDSEIDWNVSGGKGDDEIQILGEVGKNVYGDGVLSGFATGGDDDIIISGTVEGDVMGDGLLGLGGEGGDDFVFVNGTVEGDVMGDGIAGFVGYGGDDLIVVTGTVEGDVLGDGVLSLVGEDGDDYVVVGDGAVIGGTINGGGNSEEVGDTLEFEAYFQDELDELDPYEGTIGGYTWINFESLIGKIREVVAALVGAGEERAIIYLSGGLLGVNEDTGIKVFSEDGTVAFIPFAELALMLTGDSVTFQAPNSGGWYAVATDLGVNPDNGGNHLYQISIYNAGGVLQGQFTITN